MDRSTVAALRKRMLRRGRAILRGSGGVLASLSESHRQELAEIHAALERIERGVYGRCAVCMTDLEASRLDMEPCTTRCKGCHAGDAHGLDVP